jgi:hypothetical protein
MAAGKIKITVDNLDDAQGVVVDEGNSVDDLLNKEDKVKKVSKKKLIEKKIDKTVSAKPKKKRGRPPKNPVKTSKKVSRNSDERDDSLPVDRAGIHELKKEEEDIEIPNEEIDVVGDFMSKINVTDSEKKEVINELEKKSVDKENETEEDNKEDNKEILKFSSLAKDEFNEDPVKKDNTSYDDLDIDNDGTHVKRSVGLYRKIAIFFLIATMILLVFIFYFLFASVTITIIPDQERINNNMIIDVYDKDNEGELGSDKIAGVVKKASMELTESYQTSGEDVIGEEVVGEVIIYNYYTKNQPLVATTRLMSPDGRVYRIEETVNIPAGGEAVVRVYADDPSVNMEIGPTKFTIPGLWAGIQDKIYGESKSKIEYSQKVNKFVTQADIDNAIRDLKQRLVQKAKAEINKKYEDYSQVIYSIDDNSVFTEIEAEREDKIDEFDATITANIVTVAFDGQAAANLAEKKFVSTLSTEKELIEFNRDNIIYTLDTFDYNEGTASINSTFEGKVSLDSDSDVINKEDILDLNKAQLDAYLLNKSDISGYNIEFFPSFIKRVPSIPDKIIIKTKR